MRFMVLMAVHVRKERVSMRDQELRECIAEVKYSDIPEASKKKIIDALIENKLKSEWIPPYRVPKHNVRVLILCGRIEQHNGAPMFYLGDDERMCEIGCYIDGYGWFNSDGQKVWCVGWMPLPGQSLEDIESK